MMIKTLFANTAIGGFPQPILILALSWICAKNFISIKWHVWKRTKTENVRYQLQINLFCEKLFDGTYIVFSCETSVRHKRLSILIKVSICNFLTLTWVIVGSRHKQWMCLYVLFRTRKFLFLNIIWTVVI